MRPLTLIPPRYHHVKTTAFLVRPYGADFMPFGVLVATFLCIYHDIGCMAGFYFLGHVTCFFLLLKRKPS